jgi:hypothetical protein
MASPSRSQIKNKLLSWGLFIYLVSFIAISPKSGNPDQIRIPGFALLLLILVQVIFPNFRFSKLSNFLAIFIILATAIILSIFPLR